MSEHDRLMTLQEVAEYLGKPPQTLYMWRTRGDGPRSYRVGRHVRYRKPEVDEWLERRASRERA
jgi:excisionase family DNA binding protein